ncbi:MAG: UDP-N-acetylmuramoyl-L-alanine--D-glutamate ligase [Gammaproteobacteria bacterium]|nr:UDP-N-acetylmuramoyl-L-alanine--D-glutamate ligase [Gammaproteobacteria bacterium]
MIIGLGMTGLSCARYLHGKGYAVAVTDSRAAPPGLADLQRDIPDAAIFVGGFSDVALASADLVLVSPGIPLNDPFILRVRDAGVDLIGDIELFAREAQAPIVGVTGSNGKSTVATLFALMVQSAGMRAGLGGNVGRPALELLDEAVPDFYVLELSSFQLESTRSLECRAASVLNISPDHIDWHGSLEHYAAAKARLFDGAQVCVFNRDDAETVRMGEARDNAVSFGLDAPEREIDFGLREKDGRYWLARGSESLLPVDEMLLAGRHNWANALACLALGFSCGLPKMAMLEALRTFRGLPHRMAWVAEHNGVQYINDSKATNVGAAIAAITGSTRPVVLIAGGDGKGGDFDALVEALPGKVRHVVLIGQDADRIAAALDHDGAEIDWQRAGSMHEAVMLASRVAESGDMVLLSPACASFDMFSGYADRGKAFVNAVEALA